MADFDNEDAVLAEVAKALDIDPDDLHIGENRGLTGFGAGTVYEITIIGGRTGKEWSVVEDDDQMRALALEVVKQDLESEPELFTQSWLEDFIDKDRLRRDLESDVQNMAEEDLREMRESEFWRTAEQYGFNPQYIVNWDTPDANGTLPDKFEDEDDADDAGEAWKKSALAQAEREAKGEDDDVDEDDYWFDVAQAEPDDSLIGEIAEAITEDRLRDPMQYLEDIYGDEAAQKAMEIAGFDIDAAAEDAVDTDGAEHFLARYDGNYYETKSGFVYWRDN